MADNTILNLGTGGDTIATDDISGVKYQRVKLSLGADGTATDVALGSTTKANAIPVTLATDDASVSDTMITGQATQTASGNNILLATAGTGSVDVNGYDAIYIQIIPTGTVSSGVVTFESSNDGTTFVATPMYDIASLTANPVTTVSPATGVNRFFKTSVGFRYFRARISTVIGGGGSIAAVTKLSPHSFFSTQQTVTQATGANLSVAIASGTVTTVSTVTSCTTLANGQTAHSSASTGSPVRVGGRALTTVDTTIATGDASDLIMTTNGAATVKLYAVGELDWTYSAAASGISNTTTAVTIKSAAAASVRNYITSIDISTDGALGAATEVAIRDGAAGTVIWRMKIGTAGLQGGRTINFPTPLRGTAATLLEVVTLTATTTGAVYFNAQGYTAI